MWFFLLVSFVSAASVAAQNRGDAFLGCSSEYGGSTSFLTAAVTSIECAAVCTARPTTGIQYSNFRDSSRECRCTNAPAPVDTYGASLSIAEPTQCQFNTDYSIIRMRTTFQFDGCTDSVTYVNAFVAAADFDEAFDACRFSAGLYIFQDSSAVYYSCVPRGTAISTGGSAVCERSASYFVYSHPDPAPSLGLNRKRRVRVNEAEQYCPAGLTACKVPKSDGYECIDTKSELESCGGCMYGQYGHNGTSVSVEGINCAALDGKLDGGFTCRKGQCISLAAIARKSV